MPIASDPNPNSYEPRMKEIRSPTTDMGKEMQRIWSHVLNINSDTVGLDDGYGRLGGNSHNSVKVANMTHRAGIDLTVAEMFRYSETTIERPLQIPCGNDTCRKNTSANTVSQRYLMAAIEEWDTCIASMQTGAKSHIVDSDMQAGSDQLQAVLLTGVNGFIGTQILRQLLEQAESILR